MSKWSAILSGSITFLAMFGLAKTKIYSDVSSNILVFFLLLFFFSAMSYFIDKLIEDNNNPIKKKKKKSRGDIVEVFD